MSVDIEMREMHKITVNYIYDKSYIGQMDFRFREWNDIYHSKSWLQDINKCTRVIEVLQ